MKAIHFVTSNAAKVANARAALKPFGIIVKQLNVDLVESRAIKVRVTWKEQSLDGRSSTR